jgi:purine-binding chemotaxis protein CheW
MITPSTHQNPEAVLLVHLADRSFGLPLAVVQRVLPMAAVTSLPEAGEGLIGVLNLHGDILPVVDPRPRLGLPTPQLNAEQRLVLVTGSSRFLLWVDAIEEVVSGADAMTTVAAQHTSPLVPRVIRLGDKVVPILAPSVFEPRSGVAR